MNPTTVYCDAEHCKFQKLDLGSYTPHTMCTKEVIELRNHSFDAFGKVNSGVCQDYKKKKGY